jgi:signal peptidase I
MSPSLKKFLIFLAVELVYILLVKLTGLNWFYFGTLAIADHFYWNYINWTFWKKREVKEEKTESISSIRDWFNAISFAVIGATLIHTFVIQPFTIPTSSMEKSMLIGDYLLVSKLNYGPVVPNTPVSLPFLHNTLPFTRSGKSYSDGVQLGYNRLPGFAEVKNNDIVVFNYPEDDLQKNMPFDKKTHYVKRCIAIAGDDLEIRDKDIYVNGKLQLLPDRSKGQFSYELKLNKKYDPHFLVNRDITDLRNHYYKQVDPRGWIPEIDDKKQLDVKSDSFTIHTTEEQYKILKAQKFVRSITPIVPSSTQKGIYIFPGDKDRGWDVNNMGPIHIPKAGETVELSLANLAFYRRIIGDYEGNKLLVKNKTIYINDEIATSYTFKMNYYWMMGDNRHNSLDSRFWGFVPENHVVGKPVFNWLSIDKNAPLGINKIRWSRMFTFYHGDGQAKSYLIHFLVLVAIMKGISFYRKKKQAA